MLKLPGPLSQWHSLLSLFPDDLAEAFSELLIKLAPLVGDLAHDELDGVIEPDGYSGLTRKANYERLLLSEWALGDYHPDEFMRKAVSGEHQFLALSQTEKRQTKVSVVLFDCGPALLGQPRILQLALIILFARRAEASNAEFHWGVIQDPTLELFNHVDEYNIQHFLNARSIESARPQVIDAKLMSLGIDVDDLWLVGSVSDKDFPANSHFIAIECPFLKPELLQVSIQKIAQKPREIHLKLPDKANQTRVLRDPFAKRKTTKKLVVDSNTRWTIGCNGRQVAFPNRFGEIEIYAIPLKHQKNEPHVIRTAPHQTGRRLLGFHLTKRGFQLLSYDRDNFYFSGESGSREELIIRRQQMIKTDDNTLQNVIISKTNDAILICDSSKRMREINPALTSKNVTTRFRNVIAHGLYNGCGVCVSYNRDSETLKIAWFINQSNGCQREFTCELSGTPKVFLHGSGVWGISKIGCFGFEVDYNTWQLVVQNDSLRIPVADEAIIFGVLAHSKKLPQCEFSKEPCLVSYNPQTESFNAIYTNRSVHLCDITETPRNLTLNSHHPIVHYNAPNGDFVTLDLKNGIELLRLEQS